jgi:hypothetical protein
VLQFSFQYNPLFTCTFQHLFFADKGSALFKMVPTAETELLLRRLGLVFKGHAGVWNCLYNPEAQEGLLAELEREKDLVFRFWVEEQTGAFINITDMPVQSVGSMYYFSNVNRQAEGDFELWHSNTIAQAEQLHPFWHQIQWSEKWLGKKVSLKKGQKILQTVQLESLTMPLNLPTGLYSVGNDELGWNTFLHSKEVGAKKPLALVEVSLVNGAYDEVYTSLVERHFKASRGLVRFGSRATDWRYYIVQKYNVASDRYRIHTNDTKLEFSGPEEVKLSSGERALLFKSNVSIPLSQKITHNFQLRNKDGKILVQRLPVAAADQIIPESHNGISKIFSDIKIYV